LSRHRKTKQAEIPTIRDFEWLGRVDDSQIAGSADLLVATLSIATNAVELEIDKVHITDASGDVRAQAEDHVPCGFDTRNLDRRDVSSRDDPLERLLCDFPRFELNESVG
jgi:hypothetical protein